MFKMNEDDKNFFKLIKKKPWILIAMLLSAYIMSLLIGT